MLGLDIKFIKLDLVLLKKQLEWLSLKYGPFEERFLNLCDNNERNTSSSSIFNIFTEKHIDLDLNALLNHCCLQAKLFSKNNKFQIIARGRSSELQLLEDYKANQQSLLRSSNSCSINFLGGTDVFIELIHVVDILKPSITIGTVHLSICMYRLKLISTCQLCEIKNINTRKAKIEPQTIIKYDTHENEYSIKSNSSDSDSSINAFMNRFDKTKPKIIHNAVVVCGEDDVNFIRKSTSSQTNKKVIIPDMKTKKKTLFNNTLTSYPASSSFLRKPSNKNYDFSRHKNKNGLKSEVANTVLSYTMDLASLSVPIQQSNYRILMGKCEAENYLKIKDCHNNNTNVVLSEDNTTATHYINDSIVINHYSRMLSPIYQPDPIPLYFCHS